MEIEKSNRATYSDIIHPDIYNSIMRGQHLYIDEADKIMIQFILEEIDNNSAKEVVEFGCGPAGIFQDIVSIRKANFTAVDHDQKFLKNMQSLVPNGLAKFELADVTNYKHNQTVDIFYSHGMHHHIQKGKPLNNYLRNIYKQLRPKGVYFLTDEFLSNYNNESHRRINTIIWHSHIIAHAVRNKYKQLAIEEAKTMLDDLNELSETISYKTPKQIEHILGMVVSIDDEAINGNIKEAKHLSQNLLLSIYKLGSCNKLDDNSYDLSRGDYKVSPNILENELKNIGFIVEKKVTLGPIDSIGGIIIYAFRKPL